MFARCVDREARPEAPGLLLIGVADPSVAFDRRPGRRAITGECSIMSGLSRRGFIGSAAAGLAARRGRSDRFRLQEQRPRRAAGRARAADVQVRAGEVEGGQGHRREQRHGGDGQATADLQGDRRRLDAAGARRIARAALARHGGRVGLRRSRDACRTTVIDPEGNSETNDFGPGDIWYFPRGHGHALQGMGPGTAHFILIFDNGYFSEFGTFSITDWIGHSPRELVRKNLGLSARADREAAQGGGLLRPRPGPARGASSRPCTASSSRRR